MTKLPRLAPTNGELQKLLKVARGDEVADIIIKNVTIIDLINGDNYCSTIAISDSWIAGIHPDYVGTHEIDGTGLWAVPGFIDAHTHLESSLMHPFEFTRLTLPKGTTTAICDPHEITNVLGKPGVDWLLRCAEQLPQTLLIQVPSCIPSLIGFETNGGSLSLAEMAELKRHPHVFGLGEMMNFPGVVNGDEDVISKIALFEGLPLDGHAPMGTGMALNAYRCAGIQNCHESISSSEAIEKLRAGMAVMLREGSVAKNLDNLAEIVTEFNSHQCLLCTDDRNPYEIVQEGHLNYLVKRLIGFHNVPLHIAYRLASYATAQHYNLKRLGLIAPGYRADILLLSNPHDVAIAQVICGGKQMIEADLKDTSAKLAQSLPPLQNSLIYNDVSPDTFTLPLEDGVYTVIGVIPGEIVTTHLNRTCTQGAFSPDNINKIAVIERHGHGYPPAIGLVEGFNLFDGAIAASIAHDCHNVIVIGANDADMAAAVNHLKTIAGGITVIKNSEVIADLSLPIAGLMSIENAEFIADKLQALKLACQELGCQLHEPFLQMAFLALPVIPSLKITDKGLVATDPLEFVPLHKKAPLDGRLSYTGKALGC